MTDDNTSKLFVFLLCFIFIYGALAGGMLFVFTGSAEPTDGTLPPEPAGGDWWDPTGVMGYLGTTVTFLTGLATGFSTYGVPAPVSWLFAGMWWLTVMALIILLVRG